MSILPPPAETLARVTSGTRFALGPGGSALHVLTGTVTRCGHRTASTWTDYGLRTEGGVPALRLCRRCLAGLPAATRAALVPTATELRKVHELEARRAADELVRTLARLRTDAIVDGSALEGTRVIKAALTPYPVAPRGAKPLTRYERGIRPTGYVAVAEPMPLLELLNRLDPTRPDLPGHRVWLLDEPEPGTPVDVSDYDARLWMGRKR